MFPGLTIEQTQIGLHVSKWHMQRCSRQRTREIQNVRFKCNHLICSLLSSPLPPLFKKGEKKEKKEFGEKEVTIFCISHAMDTLTQRSGRYFELGLRQKAVS